MADNIDPVLEAHNAKLESRKEKIKNWLKDPWNLALVVIIGLIIGLYLYYFFRIGTQPIWWDEGDYLSIGKELAFNRVIKPEWWTAFINIRPLAFPIELAFFFKLGFNELPIRFFTELIPALASIFVIYLISKEIFNKKVGIIAAVLLAVNWVFMFYSFRLLTDIPSLCASALAIYFFWVKYEKPRIENKHSSPWFLYLAVFFGVLSFLIRYISVLTLIVIAFYLIFTRRFTLIKDKQIWIAVLIGIACLSPYFIYNYINTKGNLFPALAWYHGAESTAAVRPPAWNTLTYHIPNFFGMYETILFAIGCLILIGIILLYFDFVLKQKNKSMNGQLFCLLGILIPLGYFIFGIRAVDARYFIATAPLMFAAVAFGIDTISSNLSKLLNIKIISILVILILCGLVVFQNLAISESFISSRVSSYLEEQEAGLWIKENSNFNDGVITASVTQMEYYTERLTYGFMPATDEDMAEWNKCYYRENPLSDPIMNQTEACINFTISIFNRRIKDVNPKYYVVHVFEPAFTPEWAYSYYPQEYNLIPVKYYAQGNQTMLVIYQFPENFTSSL
jgi:4-amino-4-deoxy-L-arabinose transferase-like glycosyltransferase